MIPVPEKRMADSERTGSGTAYPLKTVFNLPSDYLAVRRAGTTLRRNMDD